MRMCGMYYEPSQMERSCSAASGSVVASEALTVRSISEGNIRVHAFEGLEEADFSSVAESSMSYALTLGIVSYNYNDNDNDE